MNDKSTTVNLFAVQGETILVIRVEIHTLSPYYIDICSLMHLFFSIVYHFLTLCN